MRYQVFILTNKSPAALLQSFLKLELKTCLCGRNIYKEEKRYILHWP